MLLGLSVSFWYKWPRRYLWKTLVVSHRIWKIAKNFNSDLSFPKKDWQINLDVIYIVLDSQQRNKCLNKWIHYIFLKRSTVTFPHFVYHLYMYDCYSFTLIHQETEQIAERWGSNWTYSLALLKRKLNNWQGN